MAGRGKDETRRETCVDRAVCQRRPRSNEPVRRNALAGLHRHRRVSSFAKKWITFAKASTAHARRSRPSRSGCPRRAKPVSSFLPQRRGRHPSVRAALPSVSCGEDPIRTRRPHRVRALRSRRSSTRAILPRRRVRSRDTHAAAHENVRRFRGGDSREPERGSTVEPAIESGTGRASNRSRGTPGLVSGRNRLLDDVHPAGDCSLARIRSHRALASRRLDPVCVSTRSGRRRRGESRAVRPARCLDCAPRPAAGARSHGRSRLRLLALWRVDPDLQPVSVSLLK